MVLMQGPGKDFSKSPVFQEAPSSSPPAMFNQLPSGNPFRTAASFHTHSVTGDDFQPFEQASSNGAFVMPQNGSIGHTFHPPSFASFHTTSTGTTDLSEGFSHVQSISDSQPCNSNETSKTNQPSTNPQLPDFDLSSFFNPWSRKESVQEITNGLVENTNGGHPQTQQLGNPFASPMFSGFWNDPLLTGLVDLNIAGGTLSIIRPVHSHLTELVTWSQL